MSLSSMITCHVLFCPAWDMNNPQCCMCSLPAGYFIAIALLVSEYCVQRAPVLHDGPKPKHKSSHAGHLGMPERSASVCLLSDKGRFFNKKNNSWAEVTAICMWYTETERECEQARLCNFCIVHYSSVLLLALIVNFILCPVYK